MVAAITGLITGVAGLIAAVTVLLRQVRHQANPHAHTDQSK